MLVFTRTWPMLKHLTILRTCSIRLTLMHLPKSYPCPPEFIWTDVPYLLSMLSAPCFLILLHFGVRVSFQLTRCSRLKYPTHALIPGHISLNSAQSRTRGEVGCASVSHTRQSHVKWVHALCVTDVSYRQAYNVYFWHTITWYILVLAPDGGESIQLCVTW
jgi:hypothetical protein